MQYSYLPSWIPFLVDQEEAAAAGRGLITAVHDRWSQLPASSRPRLLLFGESLGSYGTEAAFADIDEMAAGIDGALLVGPVFQNDPPRIVYLQDSSDPITLFTPDLLWRRPAWLDQPRGPDVSPAMIYLPVITFWQVASSTRPTKPPSAAAPVNEQPRRRRPPRHPDDNTITANGIVTARPFRRCGLVLRCEPAAPRDATVRRHLSRRPATGSAPCGRRPGRPVRARCPACFPLRPS